MNDFGEILINLQTKLTSLKKEFEQEKRDIFYLETLTEELLTSALNYRDKNDEFIDRYDLKDLNNIISETKNLINAIKKDIKIQNNAEYFNSINNI